MLKQLKHDHTRIDEEKNQTALELERVKRELQNKDEELKKKSMEVV